MVEGTHPNEEAKAILTLEMRIAKEHWSRYRLNDPVKLYHLYTPEELKLSFTALNWPQYLQELGIQSAQSVILNQPSYIKALQALLLRLPLSDWKAYLKWQVLNTYAPYLHGAMVQLYDDFYQQPSFRHVFHQDQEQKALDAVKREMAWELSQVYS